MTGYIMLKAVEYFCCLLASWQSLGLFPVKISMNREHRTEDTNSFQQLCAALLMAMSLGITDTSPSYSKSPVFEESTKLIPLAEKYLQEHKPEAAKNLLETTLQLDPENLKARLFLGQSYFLKKDYARARCELRRCLLAKEDLEVARAANQLLLKLPHRFLCPKQVGSLATSFWDTPINKQQILIFCASWQSDCQMLKETAQSALGKSASIKVKMLAIDDPNNPQIFDLYSVTALPTVIVLSKDNQHIIASLTGSVHPRQLLRFMQNHARRI